VMRELVVLHELAHHLTPDDPGHGAQFVGALLTLVAEIIGPEAALVLQAALHENGATSR
jgi:putative metallohydrolase (TIGR04338 family)